MTIQIAQIAISVALIVLILLQERSAGLSSLFGSESGYYQTRRGLERVVFAGTIILGIIFIGLALWQLVA